MRSCTERGQSEVIGIVLLIGVVVTLVFGAGMVLFADWQSETEREHRMNVESDVTAVGMTLEHMGGASAAADELEIVLQGDVEKRLSVDEFDTAGERFEPGDSWDNSFEEVKSGIVDVLLIRTDSNTVVHEATYEIGEAGIELTVEEPLLDIGETSDYTVFRTFERAAAENVTDDVNVEILDGEDAIAVDESHAEIIGEEAGEATIQASYEEFTDTASVTVREDEEEAFFAVDIDETNSPVTEGETLEAEVTIENTGDEEATQTLELTDFDGNIVDTKDITLDGGESDSSITLTWNTDEGDTDTDEITVASDDDEDAEEVTIEEKAFFAVSIDDVDEEVTEGEGVTIEYTVENTGGSDGEQDIVFEIDGEQKDVESGVALAPSETFSKQFTYTTDADDTPEITASVVSNDDDATREVTIEQRPTIESIDITDNSDWFFWPLPPSYIYTVEYIVEYTIDDPDDRWDRIEVEFTNVDQGEVDEQENDEALSGSFEHTYTDWRFSETADQYEIMIRLYDDDGEVTDERIVVVDEADGESPDV